MVAAQLEQHQGQQQASIGAVMTGPAAHRVPQDRQVLQIAEAQARKAEFRRFAAGADHAGTTIRLWLGESPVPRKDYSRRPDFVVGYCLGN